MQLIVCTFLAAAFWHYQTLVLADNIDDFNYDTFSEKSVRPVSDKTTNTSKVSQQLLTILESLKSFKFRQNQVIARSILRSAIDHLSRTVALFHGSRIELAGSAFEGTSVGDTADYDSFVILNKNITERLQIVPVNDESVWFHIRIRDGVDTDEFFRKYPQLRPFCSPSGMINIKLFKQWAFFEMAKALTFAFSTSPFTKKSIYFGVGAVGADVWPSNKVPFSIDFVPTLGLSNKLLKKQFLAHCPTAAVTELPRDHPDHNWFLVSLHDINTPSTNVSSEYSAVSGTQMIERHLIRSLPILQHVNRLLKALRLSRKWPLASFVLKHELLNTYSRTCNTVSWNKSNIEQLLVQCLENLVHSIDEGRLSEFFFERPVNLLNLPQRATPSYTKIKSDSLLAIDSLKYGNTTLISQLFQIQR